MTQPLALSLGQLSRIYPNIAHAVAMLGLDFRNYPEMPLSDALECLGLKVDIDTLVSHASLWCFPCDVCWPSVSLTGIIAHIRDQHHRFLSNELPRIQLLLCRAADHETDAIRNLAKSLLRPFSSLKADMEIHLRNEEELLFPLVSEIERATAPFPISCATVRNPIGEMMTEHERAKNALREILDIARDHTPESIPIPVVKVISSALNQLEVDLLAHIREEDDILFPRVIALEDELFGR